MREPKINPGRLNHRGMLQIAEDVSDGMGGVRRQWRDEAPIALALVRQSERYRQRFEREESVERITFRCRYSDRITRGKRVLIDDRAFILEQVSDLALRHRLMECEGREDA